MKRAISSVMVLLLTSLLVSAQMLNGKITNASGNPVPFSTIYIQELRQGTAANAMGNYEIKLPAGQYVVTYQCMGFAPQYFNLTISGQNVRKDGYQLRKVKNDVGIRVTSPGLGSELGWTRSVC